MIKFLERRVPYLSKLNVYDSYWLRIRLFNSSFSSVSESFSNGSTYFSETTIFPLTTVFDRLDIGCSGDRLEIYTINFFSGERPTENEGCRSFIFSGDSIWSFCSISGIWSIFFRFMLDWHIPEEDSCSKLRGDEPWLTAF